MKRLVLFLLIGILLVGCGTSSTNDSDEQNQDGKTNGSGEVTNHEVDNGSEGEEESADGEDNGIIAGKVVPVLTETNPLLYTYEVANQTEKEITLEFTSSQRFDYAVETKEGEQVYLYSSVASFMQALGEETIKQGGSLEFEINLNELDLEPGDYVLKAWMTPTGSKKYEVSHDFTITE
ncbi:BsuPI-related putative proteinase inhibitor [Aquibacillus koreensis]|uniref:Intracellular proteinase inhibitor BsuPI domain-containing protein n=1 Tax=Aquibacillus koreensis TaxID=279446 RepID=A0A9X3WHU0_9BACI|nr:BsuPI-related putative proteinase inhibitor [Aquibacillus koreensis]MCT2535725.1 BsuPI-related putative proteinase inhibitor [Aquibacillus koreensis]MDC3419990.1 BsuPI-related putative proteinase inhibitor [Aquibacillus koreensis]